MPTYIGIRCVDLPVPENYKEAREYIFGKGGKIKDSSVAISAYLSTRPYKGKPYIKPDDEVINNFINCFPEEIRDYVRFEVIDAMMLKITNAFQELSNGNTEKAYEIINELNSLLDFLIKNQKKPNIECNISVSLDTENNCYIVELVEET